VRCRRTSSLALSNVDSRRIFTGKQVVDQTGYDISAGHNFFPGKQESFINYLGRGLQSCSISLAIHIYPAGLGIVPDLKKKFGNTYITKGHCLTFLLYANSCDTLLSVHI
jgi:hypothetical protein